MRRVLVVALSLAMVCTACSTAWVSTLDSILAAAAPALIDILQIVAVANGQPVNGNLEAKINADATVIKTLAADFAKASVDLREWGGPIKDQGEEGSCTGHAFSSARERME